MIPKRKKRAKMGLRASSVIKCAGHLKWVRGHECLCAGKWGHECAGRIEAHHVTSRGAGGGDEQVVPLCTLAHGIVHQMGGSSFAASFKLDLAATAADLWKHSPHGQRYRLQTPSGA